MLLIEPLGFGRNAAATEIPGIPPSLPPGMKRQIEFFFGNDFLARAGDLDDYRTQQTAVVAQFGDRWSALIGHSIMTLETPKSGPPGRLDQLNGSIGYRVFEESESMDRRVIEIGGGFRYSANLNGDRLQNGFHKLFDSGIKDLPYVPTDRVDATVWLRLDETAVLRDGLKFGSLGSDWQLGYWARGSTLVTTDGQWDGNVGLLGFATKGGFQAWLGLEGNWRSGYDRDNVQRETADAEDGGSVVFGLRFGPLLFETQQNFDGDTANGHLSLVSQGEPLRKMPDSVGDFGVQVGLAIPDVYASLQGRWGLCGQLRCPADWQRTVLLDLRYGKPAFGDYVTQFVATMQVSTGIEFEKVVHPSFDWLTSYAAAGIGWRQERLKGEGALVGQESESVDRIGLVGDIGVRFSTSAQYSSWDLLMQMGLSAWLPSSDGKVLFAGQIETLQEPELVLQFGVLARFF